MIELVRDVVAHLHAAMQARKVYGEDHPVWAERLREVVRSLRAAAPDGGELRLVCIGGRVFWNDQSIADGTGPGSIGAALEHDGLSWLSVGSGASEDDLACLIRACVVGEDLRAALDGRHALRVRTASVAGERDSAATSGNAMLLRRFAMDEMCDEVGQGLEGAIRSPAESARRLVGLVDRIAAVVASARTAMLPLASLKTHDEYTYVHTVNVGIMSAALAEAVGLRADQVHDIMLGAILHDIGKQLVPKSILNKGGKLTDDEAEVMRRHPVDGARVLLDSGDLPDLVPIIAFEHHMHVNGGGYPKMPRRWVCNLAGQIVHVADVFDALRTNRPYRAALSTTEACGIMYRGADGEFDRALLDAFFGQVVVRSERDSGPASAKAA